MRRWPLYALGVLWSVWMYLGIQTGEWLARRWPADGLSNCWLWAIRQKQLQGGFIQFHDSAFGGWWHAVHVGPLGMAREFDPLARKVRRRFPPPLFRGRVVQMRPPR